MNWTWIGILSLTGIVMGLLTSLVGLPWGLEPAVWVGFYIVWAVVVLKRGLAPFATPFAASIGSGVLVSLTQFALWEQYVASNPWYFEDVATATERSLPALMGFGIGMGIGWGLLVGGTCWAIARWKAEKPAA